MFLKQSVMMILTAVLLALIACQRTPPPSTLSQIVVPTRVPPPPTVSVSIALESPNEEVVYWQHYRDPNFGFGLALPESWYINPLDRPDAQTQLIVANYEPTIAEASCSRPSGLVQLDIVATSLTADVATADWIISTNPNLVKMEEWYVGRYGGFTVETDGRFQLVARVTPNILITFQTDQVIDWTHPDIAAILQSLAAPRDEIIQPAHNPVPAKVTTNFCQKQVSLYDGPGTHFELVGVLESDVMYNAIERSLDGRWVKLVYTDTVDGVAWAYGETTIVTSGR